ncbi:hypothetical protein KAT24_01455 [Candidatus Pacearchaeota archaeon]|nr:hypothetical protein [Candidatus Pacearchaeota archaeon]
MDPYKKLGISDVKKVWARPPLSRGPMGTILDLSHKLLKSHRGKYVVFDEISWPYTYSLCRTPNPQADVFESRKSAEEIADYLNEENASKHYTPIKINETSLKKLGKTENPKKQI